MREFGKPVCAPQSVTAEENQKKQTYVIGGVTYLVISHYKETGNTTVIDKVSRLIEQDTQTQ